MRSTASKTAKMVSIGGVLALCALAPAASQRLTYNSALARSAAPVSSAPQATVQPDASTTPVERAERSSAPAVSSDTTDETAGAGSYPITAPPVHRPLIPAPPAADDYPVRVSIASIHLNSRVLPLGVDSLGNMDVPDGSTNNVGWYRGGTLPGAAGSAVLDAHVFAAFRNLSNVRVGDPIIVTTKSGKRLRFIVQAARTYPLAQVPDASLFGANDPSGAAHLNLITCAGSLTPDRSTYDHRLVVWALLDSNA